MLYRVGNCFFLFKKKEKEKKEYNFKREINFLLSFSFPVLFFLKYIKIHIYLSSMFINILHYFLSFHKHTFLSHNKPQPFWTCIINSLSKHFLTVFRSSLPLWLRSDQKIKFLWDTVHVSYYKMAALFHIHFLKKNLINPCTYIFSSK
jgi:hypothetical protein